MITYFFLFLFIFVFLGFFFFSFFHSFFLVFFLSSVSSFFLFLGSFILSFLFTFFLSLFLLSFFLSFKPLSHFLCLCLSLSLNILSEPFQAEELLFFTDVKKKVKLAILFESDQKVPFSTDTTPRHRGGHYSIPWIAPLYPSSLRCWVLSKAASSILFWVFCMTQTWIESPASRTIGKHSTH